MLKKQEPESFLKSNWYLIVAVVVLLAGGAIMAFMSSGPEEPKPTGVIGSAGDGVDIVRLSDDEIVDQETVEHYEGLTQEQKDAKYIEDYEAKLAADPDGPDTAATMSSLGVVYRRQGKHAQAAAVFEDILLKFPGTPNARTAILLLPDIYLAAGDTEMARDTYRRMVEYFPPESEEHKYAAQRIEEI